MDLTETINPSFCAVAILFSASVFTFIWFLDSLTHAKLVKVDITDKELQTHRIILVTSFLMEGSLVLLYWFHLEVLPLFAALFITRTVHEFIDELHWHTDRCTAYESMLHLGMWISVLTKTFLMFTWGFFGHYKGIWDLHPLFFVWGIVLFSCMSVISFNEWRR